MSMIVTPFTNPFDTVLLVGAFSTAVLLGFAWILCTNGEKCRNISKFMWSCFVKPISNHDSGWGGALEGFYAGQADVYDATRQGLLKGRTTMMKLAAAHLRAGLQKQEKGQLVWVDVIASRLIEMLITDRRGDGMECGKNERNLPIAGVFPQSLYCRFIAFAVQCRQRTDSASSSFRPRSSPLRRCGHVRTP
jgi:hypothetical protein